jgi:hypothetical protein
VLVSPAAVNSSRGVAGASIIMLMISSSRCGDQGMQVLLLSAADCTLVMQQT